MELLTGKPIGSKLDGGKGVGVVVSPTQPTWIARRKTTWGSTANDGAPRYEYRGGSPCRTKKSKLGNPLIMLDERIKRRYDPFEQGVCWTAPECARRSPVDRGLRRRLKLPGAHHKFWLCRISVPTLLPFASTPYRANRLFKEKLDLPIQRSALSRSEFSQAGLEIRWDTYQKSLLALGHLLRHHVSICN